MYTGIDEQKIFSVAFVFDSFISFLSSKAILGDKTSYSAKSNFANFDCCKAAI